MTTDQISYLVLGGAGLGVLAGSLVRTSPGGRPKLSAGPGPEVPQPQPPAPEPPPDDEKAHALVMERQDRLRKIARGLPKPD